MLDMGLFRELWVRTPILRTPSFQVLFSGVRPVNR